MSNEVALRLRRAHVFLRQALGHDAATEAESAIDAGYYAMFHAASAVVIAKTGSAPKTHSGVVGQFGAIASRLGMPERQAGKAINRALDDRLVSHYDPDPDDLSRRAERIKAEVSDFVSICEMLCKGGAR